jgi:type I restriction enzyme M protein
MNNKFGELNHLRNESDVEQFFIIKLIHDLGFKQENVFTKKSLPAFRVGKGARKKYVIPDYQLNEGKSPRIIIEAKAPDVNLNESVIEAQEYAMAVNRNYIGENPVKYCIASNGVKTILIKPDENAEALKLDYEDFVDGNQKYEQLKSLISYQNIKKGIPSKNIFEFKKPEIDELRAILSIAHNKIRSKEKIGPKKAFYEFSKLLFVKMNEDAKIEHKLKTSDFVTIDDFVFSVYSIDKFRDIDPIKMQFRKYREELEEAVIRGEKKRIFKRDEEIDLKSNTIRSVVELIQNYNLKSIEDDINGKVFETFLESSVRGKELGQFFTPRSVVKFIVKMCDLRIRKSKSGKWVPDRILDGSCGTGGFLIFALSDLFTKIPSSLTSVEAQGIKDLIKNHAIYGIDASKDDIVPITRMNMYLHGDGGSHIFLADTLDKDFFVESGEDKETREQIKELQNICKNILFDVVITNPPFSMSYNEDDSEQSRILKQYSISRLNNRQTKSLKSNVMFLERYFDLLKPGGKLITVIDESVLNTEGPGKYMLHFRKWMMSHYIIRAIISLPKNTFVNQDAGVKTSVVYLTKKTTDDEMQPPVFMAISNDVGHNDAGRTTSEMGDLDEILTKFKEFQKGNFE